MSTDDSIDDMGLGDDDDFDVGDIDFGDDSFGELPDNNPKSRTPIAGLVGDTGRSFTETFSDDKIGTVLDVGKAAIPKQLSKETDVVVNTYNTISEEVTKQKSKLAREAKQTLRTFKRVLPEGDNIGNRVIDKISGLLGGDEETSTASAGPSRAELIANEINGLMGDKTSDDDYAEQFKAQVEFNRSKELKEIQATESVNIERMRKFMFEVSDKYYRSSLSVALRQLYNLEELVSVTKAGFDVFKATLTAIAKNTALPEITKIKNSEIVEQRIKSNLVNSLGSGLFDKTGAADKLTGKITAGINNLSGKASEYMQQAAGGIESGSSLGEMGMTRGQMLGMILGEQLKTSAGKAIGKVIGDSDAGKDGVYATKNAFADIGGFLKKYSQGDGLGSSVAGFASDAIGSGRTNYSVDVGDQNAAAILDNRTLNSINKVIPELLTKIYGEVKTNREIQTTVHQNVAGIKDLASPADNELTYDHKSASLIAKTDLRKSLTDLNSESIKTGVSKRADDVVRGILENSKAKFSQDEFKAIKHAFITTVLKKGTGALETTVENKLFQQTLNESGPKLFGKFKSELIEFKERTEKDDNLFDRVDRDIKSIRSSTTLHENIANDLVQRGLGDEAVNLGYLTKTKEGGLVGNRDGQVDDIISQAKNMETSKAKVKEKTLNELRKEYMKSGMSMFEASKQAAIDIKDRTVEAAKAKEDENVTAGSKGYAFGKYTGDGARHEVAGTVHKSEFVITKPEVSELVKNVVSGNTKAVSDYATKVAKDVLSKSESRFGNNEKVATLIKSIDKHISKKDPDKEIPAESKTPAISETVSELGNKLIGFFDRAKDKVNPADTKPDTVSIDADKTSVETANNVINTPKVFSNSPLGKKISSAIDTTTTAVVNTGLIKKISPVSENSDISNETANTLGVKTADGIDAAIGAVSNKFLLAKNRVLTVIPKHEVSDTDNVKDKTNVPYVFSKSKLGQQISTAIDTGADKVSNNKLIKRIIPKEVNAAPSTGDNRTLGSKTASNIDTAMSAVSGNISIARDRVTAAMPKEGLLNAAKLTAEKTRAGDVGKETHGVVAHWRLASDRADSNSKYSKLISSINKLLSGKKLNANTSVTTVIAKIYADAISKYVQAHPDAKKHTISDLIDIVGPSIMATASDELMAKASGVTIDVSYDHLESLYEDKKKLVKEKTTEARKRVAKLHIKRKAKNAVDSLDISSHKQILGVAISSGKLSKHHIKIYKDSNELDQTKLVLAVEALRANKRPSGDRRLLKTAHAYYTAINEYINDNPELAKTMSTKALMETVSEGKLTDAARVIGAGATATLNTAIDAALDPKAAGKKIAAKAKAVRDDDRVKNAKTVVTSKLEEAKHKANSYLDNVKPISAKTESLRSSTISERASKQRKALNKKGNSQLITAIESLMSGKRAKVGDKRMTMLAGEYYQAISKYKKANPDTSKDYTTEELINIVDKSAVESAAVMVSGVGSRLSNKLTTVSKSVTGLGDNSYVKDNKLLKSKSEKYGNDSGWDGESYIAKWDDYKKEEQDALRLEFFKSEEYSSGAINSFPLWIRDLKHIDPGTLGTSKGIIMSKFINFKSTLLAPMKKFKDEAVQEVIDKLSGKSLKELNDNQEAAMRKEFYKSEEYKEKLVIDFDEWLRNLGYRRKGTSALSKLTLKNIFRQTRKLDRKIMGGLYKGAGKLLVAAPKAAVKTAYYGGKAGVFGAKHAYKAARGIPNVEGSVLDAAKSAFPEKSGSMIAGAATTAAKLPFKVGYKATKLVGGLVGDAVLDTVSAIPGLGFLDKVKRDEAKVKKEKDRYEKDKVEKKIKDKARAEEKKETSEPSNIDKLLSYFKQRDKTEADKEEDAKGKPTKSSKLLSYFKRRDASDDKDEELAAKAKAKKAKHNRFTAMFSKEEDGKTKVKHPLLRKLAKHKGGITIVTMLGAAVALMAASGTTITDVKDGVLKVVDVVKGVGKGIVKLWNGGKTVIDILKDTYTYTTQIPDRLSISLREALSHISILGIDAPDPKELNKLDSKFTKTITGASTIYKNAKDPTADKKDSVTTNIAANAVVDGAVGYVGYKGYKVARAGYRGGKSIISGASKIVNKVSGSAKVEKSAAEVAAKITSKAAAKASPSTNKIATMLKKLRPRLESKLIKKLGKTGAAKLLAKVASRFVPVLGWGLLLYDVGKTIYNMTQGDSFETAASKAMLGFDIFEDDPEVSEPGVTYKNNVIDARNRFSTTQQSATSGDYSIPNNTFTVEQSKNASAQVKALMDSGSDGEDKPKTFNGSSRATKTVKAIPVLNTPPVEGNINSLAPAPGVDIKGLNPRVLKHLLGMATEYESTTGNKLTVNSAKRSTEHQRQLRAKLGSKAARPGFSSHEFGLALDIPTAELDKLEKLGLLRKYGFTRPVGSGGTRDEKWHIEPALAALDINKAKHDPAFADAAIAASLYKGGGGYALDPNSRKYGRSKTEQLAAIHASETRVAPAKSNVIDIASKRPTVNKPTANIDVNNIPSGVSKDASKATRDTASVNTGSPAIAKSGSGAINTPSVTTQQTPIIKVEPIIKVSADVDLDKSKHLSNIALMSSKAVDLQTQMLSALGDISSKLDRDLQTSEEIKKQSPGIVERMPKQVIDLKRRTMYN